MSNLFVLFLGAPHQQALTQRHMYQKFGIFATRADLGRYVVTQRPRDRGVFRVPSLRNVVLTAPYFHDGRAPTLESAVATMARVQLGRRLTLEEIGLIVQFLHTLTGEYQGRPVATLVRPGGEKDEGIRMRSVWLRLSSS